jgi:hypothetical protein
MDNKHPQLAGVPLIVTKLETVVTETVASLRSLEPVTVSPLAVEAPKDLKLASLGQAYPNDTSYVICNACKAAYFMTEEGLVKESLRLRCFLCEKEWFQTTKRLLMTNNQHHLQDMSEFSLTLTLNPDPSQEKGQRLGLELE